MTAEYRAQVSPTPGARWITLRTYPTRAEAEIYLLLAAFPRSWAKRVRRRASRPVERRRAISVAPFVSAAPLLRKRADVLGA